MNDSKHNVHTQQQQQRKSNFYLRQGKENKNDHKNKTHTQPCTPPIQRSLSLLFSQNSPKQSRLLSLGASRGES